MKQHLLDTTILLHSRTTVSCDCLNNICTRSTQLIFTIELGWAHEPLSMAEEDLVVDGSWGRENHFASVCGLLWIDYASVDAPTSTRIWELKFGLGKSQEKEGRKLGGLGR